VVRAFAKTGRPLKTMKQLDTAAEVIPVTCPEEYEIWQQLALLPPQNVYRNNIAHLQVVVSEQINSDITACLSVCRANRDFDRKGQLASVYSLQGTDCRDGNVLKNLLIHSLQLVPVIWGYRNSAYWINHNNSMHRRHCDRNSL